jgi:hypothetical protein
MDNLIDEKIKAYSRMPGLRAYDINATFGEGQPGRIEKRLMNDSGKYLLDTNAWEAGEVAFQCLKQLYPKGITANEFTHDANYFYSMVCDDLYPQILSMAEAGRIVINPVGIGVEGMKKAWAEYGWCERVMFAFDFIDGVVASGATFDNPLNTVLPLVLLQRLEDAVIAEFMDGHGLSEAMLIVASLRDRLQPPKHVQMAIQKLQVKLDTFTQARRKGADKIHAENRSMKADVFTWLDSQPKFKSIESAAKAITKQQPIAHVTGRDWYKEWKKIRSASTP